MKKKISLIMAILIAVSLAYISINSQDKSTDITDKLIAKIGDVSIQKSEIDNFPSKQNKKIKFSFLVEQKLWKLLSEKFKVPMDDQSILEYFKLSSNQPAYDAGSTMQYYDTNRGILDALKRVVNDGISEKEVYNDSLKSIMTYNDWKRVVSSFGNRGAIKTWEMQLNNKVDISKENLVAAYKPLYIERLVTEKICLQPEVKRKIEASLLESSISSLREIWKDDTLNSGRFQYECGIEATKWTLNFLEKNIVIFDDSFDGYESYLIPMLSGASSASERLMHSKGG